MSRLLSKKYIFIIILLFIFKLSIVYAKEDSIELAEDKSTKSYIANINFPYKRTSDGKYLYCLNINKKTAKNIKANIVENSTIIDGGVIYILKNGYPNKSITGDKDKDYYITQTAIWWYLDTVYESTNLGKQFKETGTDSYNLRKYVKELKDNGYKHRNDDLKVNNSIVIKDLNVSLDNNYYVTNNIQFESKNINSYKMEIQNAPKGTKIIINDEEKEYQSIIEGNKNDLVKIKIPNENTKNKNIKLIISTIINNYMAYEYQPTDKDMQNLVLLEKSSSELIEEKDLSKLMSINEEVVDVPNTASTSSFAITFLGVLVSLFGVRWIKEYE